MFLFPSKPLYKEAGLLFFLKQGGVRISRLNDPEHRLRRDTGNGPIAPLPLDQYTDLPTEPYVLDITLSVWGVFEHT